MYPNYLLRYSNIPFDASEHSVSELTMLIFDHLKGVETNRWLQIITKVIVQYLHILCTINLFWQQFG